MGLGGPKHNQDGPKPVVRQDGASIPISVGDVVAIRGDLRKRNDGVCCYTDDQLIAGKYVKHAGHGGVWTGRVDKVQGDMALVGGGWREIESLEVMATTASAGKVGAGPVASPVAPEAATPTAKGAASVKSYDKGAEVLSPEEKDRRLGFFCSDLSEALTKFDDVERRMGAMILKCDINEASMSGGAGGDHTLQRTTETRGEWLKRVSTHWAGYLENNGATLMPVPAGEAPGAPASTADRFHAYLKAMNWVVDDVSIAAVEGEFTSSRQIADFLDAYQRARDLGDQEALAAFPKRLAEGVRTLVFLIDDRTMEDLDFGFTNYDVQRDLNRFTIEECANAPHNGLRGAYLPAHLSNAIRQDLDGAGCRDFLVAHGFHVVNNRDTGGHGEAATACGLVLSTNGYVSRLHPRSVRDLVSMLETMGFRRESDSPASGALRYDLSGERARYILVSNAFGGGWPTTEAEGVGAGLYEGQERLDEAGGSNDGRTLPSVLEQVDGVVCAVKYWMGGTTPTGKGA